MEKNNSSNKYYKNVIMRKEEKFTNFIVTYELLETYTNNEKSFSIKASKKPTSKRKPHSRNKKSEDAVLQNFESRKEKAIRIYNAVVENKVTPMCLYDSVLELI